MAAGSQSERPAGQIKAAVRQSARPPCRHRDVTEGMFMAGYNSGPFPAPARWGRGGQVESAPAPQPPLFGALPGRLPRPAGAEPGWAPPARKARASPRSTGWTTCWARWRASCRRAARRGTPRSGSCGSRWRTTTCGCASRSSPTRWSSPKTAGRGAAGPAPSRRLPAPAHAHFLREWAARGPGGGGLPAEPGAAGRCPPPCLAPPCPPQEDVPGAEGERVGAGSQRHVLLLAGLRGGRRAPLEVRERGVGAGREAGAAGAQLRLHPPRLAQLRSALDEGARLLQQSQTHQQTQRRRAGKRRHRHWVLHRAALAPLSVAGATCPVPAGRRVRPSHCSRPP